MYVKVRLLKHEAGGPSSRLDCRKRAKTERIVSRCLGFANQLTL